LELGSLEPFVVEGGAVALELEEVVEQDVSRLWPLECPAPNAPHCLKH